MAPRDDDFPRHDNAGAGGLSSGPSEPSVPGAASGGDESKADSSATAGDSAGGLGGNLSAFGTGAMRIGYGIAATGVNGARMAARGVNTLMHKMIGVMIAAGSGLSVATGGMISARAGAVAAGGGSTAALGLVVSLVMGLLFQTPQMRDEGLPLCVEADSADLTPKGGSVDKEAEVEAVAEEIYGALSYAGMSDENIAGLLGNFETESGMDPTAVERIFDEPFQVGPRKQAAWNARSAGMPKGFAAQPTGIGLAQWTFGRTTLLLEFADSKGRNWHEVDLQLAFAIGADNESDRKVFENMLNNTSPGSNSPEDAAEYFLRQWERPADPEGNAPIRRKQASQWFAKMGAWDQNADLGASVLELAETSRSTANAKDAQASKVDCIDPETRTGGNEDAALAAATISWPNNPMSRGNDGHDVYRHLREQMYPGDPYYASCDRTVATAVKWSGTDDNFPVGPVTAQLEYLLGPGAAKWEQVASKVPTEQELEPGDVVLGTVTSANSHIVIYTGEEALEEVWGDHPQGRVDLTQGASVVHGSLNDRGPGADMFDAISGDSRLSYVFRNKSPETDSEYAQVQVPGNLNIGECSGTYGPGKCPMNTPG